MKINIAIVAGGDSSEYQISVNSARQVFMHLDKERFNPYIVFIRGKEWKLQLDNGNEYLIDKNDFTCRIDGEVLKFDLAFNAIHGTPGEDGKLQSYFDMLGIPYTGSRAFTSMLTFNKYACKIYLERFGILTGKSILIRKGENLVARLVEADVVYPCFVKPNNSGSSFGISRVENAEELPSAVTVALQEDEEIIVEEFIDGTEVTCGVFKSAENEFLFPLTEIISKREFFDYEAKYKPDLADEITPARISDELTQEIQQISSRIYTLLNCRGIIRIDYILSKEGPYFLEINGIPGMTAESIIPKQAKMYGLTLKELYTLVIDDALTRN